MVGKRKENKGSKGKQVQNVYEVLIISKTLQCSDKSTRYCTECRNCIMRIISTSIVKKILGKNSNLTLSGSFWNFTD
jgi:hypothetical protein